jgi:F0F1-type ATP synthase delta subunit
MILDESISSLESRQNELQTALEVAQKAQECKEVLSRVKVSAAESKAAFDEYLANREEFNRIVKIQAEKTFASLTNYYQNPFLVPARRYR